MRCWAIEGLARDPSGPGWLLGARSRWSFSIAGPRDRPRDSIDRCRRRGSAGAGTQAASGIRWHGRSGPRDGSTRPPPTYASRPVPRPVPQAPKAAGAGIQEGRRRRVRSPPGRRGDAGEPGNAGGRRGRLASQSLAHDVGGPQNGNPRHHQRNVGSGGGAASHLVVSLGNWKNSTWPSPKSML